MEARTSIEVVRCDSLEEFAAKVRPQRFVMPRLFRGQHRTDWKLQAMFDRWFAWRRNRQMKRKETQTGFGAGSRPTEIDEFAEEIGRGEWIRTTDPSVPNRVLYQAEPRPDRRKLRKDRAEAGTLAR